MKQNYPNPFNPITLIQFDIPKSGMVKLYIFDVTGRMIDVLVNEELSVGTYEYSFNAGELPSGVYFYKLESDGQKITKKMVLNK
ncbi:MAG: T9SS type A sorting domain-containing protein [Ignavibacteriaceae bacterium]|nr:T9SS type A sorting domain-containing protein [Ignavibacteriaceae bacterium]